MVDDYQRRQLIAQPFERSFGRVKCSNSVAEQLEPKRCNFEQRAIAFDQQNLGRLTKHGGIQSDTSGAQCEHLEISSLPRWAVKTNMPDSWRSSRTAPTANGSLAPNAYNPKNRYNPITRSAAGHFAKYA